MLIHGPKAFYACHGNGSTWLFRSLSRIRYLHDAVAYCSYWLGVGKY